ncbi:hypothetical protein AVEN_124914-1 [Araneus ventricosus]|uniref:Uncharacterized protein n=1 Tax=Araneus ventricosus TaxID=182803 RepID=A0A4Y2M4A5_ARAVE|nr:hypothetical protein AVEN_124914-1 [Araneus ventricosus]
MMGGETRKKKLSCPAKRGILTHGFLGSLRPEKCDADYFGRIIFGTDEVKLVLKLELRLFSGRSKESKIFYLRENAELLFCKTSSSQRILANPSDPKTYTLQPETDLKDFETQPGPSTSTYDDEVYRSDLVHRQQHLVTQPELNDLVRDLELHKSKSQLLGS